MQYQISMSPTAWDRFATYINNPTNFAQIVSRAKVGRAQSTLDCINASSTYHWLKYLGPMHAWIHVSVYNESSKSELPHQHQAIYHSTKHTCYKGVVLQTVDHHPITTIHIQHVSM